MFSKRPLALAMVSLVVAMMSRPVTMAVQDDVMAVRVVAMKGLACSIQAVVYSEPVLDVAIVFVIITLRMYLKTTL